MYLLNTIQNFKAHTLSHPKNDCDFPECAKGYTGARRILYASSLVFLFELREREQECSSRKRGDVTGGLEVRQNIETLTWWYNLIPLKMPDSRLVIDDMIQTKTLK